MCTKRATTHVRHGRKRSTGERKKKETRRMDNDMFSVQIKLKDEPSDLPAPHKTLARESASCHCMLTDFL
jgi:hypothetical protein